MFKNTYWPQINSNPNLQQPHPSQIPWGSHGDPMGIPSARYARGLLVRVSLDRFGRELLRKSQTDLTQLMKRREELGEGAVEFQLAF